MDEAEECFIRAHELERRLPGGGKWPFAGDGPWHLAQPEAGDIAGEYSETLVETGSGKVMQVLKVETLNPRAPLDAAEVGELAEVRRWLELLDDRDRRLVWQATGRLAAGEGRVPWKAVCRWVGLDRSPRTAARWYHEALARLVCTLNGWPMSRAKLMAA